MSGRALAGLGLMLLAALASAQELGRLFTTLPERSALNQLRLEAQFARPKPAPEQALEQAEAQPSADGPSVSRLEINGIVRRSGGSATVWVNGAQVERGVVSREGLRVDAGRRTLDGVQVRLPSGVRTIRLKPGQAIDVSSGTLVDAFEREPGSLAETAFEIETPAPASSGTLASIPAVGAPGDSPPTPATLSPRAVAAMSTAERTRMLNMLLQAGTEASLPGVSGEPAPAVGREP